MNKQGVHTFLLSLSTFLFSHFGSLVSDPRGHLIQIGNSVPVPYGTVYIGSSVR
jgi:hypothetical protein